MDIRFDCTQCGRCCHDLRLPLSVDEAIVWAGRGHDVQLLCDALPSLSADPPEDIAARFRHDRSFPALSGGLPIRVAVILVARHEGACPHLLADMRCGNYADRPRVCRIYPAEIAPHVPLRIENKLCPPEAWADDRPLLLRDSVAADEDVRNLIAAHQATTQGDAPVKARAAMLLGARSAALWNEGYAVHAPSPDDLVAALREARATMGEVDTGARWSIVSNRKSTLAMLRDADAEGRLCASGAGYIGFFADQG
jgi:Fe-S-cluster containining protein